MFLDALIEDLFRHQASQMVATLTRAMGGRHLALAEEAVQDAMVTALQQWPFRGVPEDPPAWLFRVARNRALDRLRHQRIVDDKATAAHRQALALVQSAPERRFLATQLEELEA